MMKIFRYALVAVLFLGLRGVAHGYAITVFDPPPSGPGFAFIDPGVPFDVTFVPCFFNTSEGCFLGINDSNTKLTTLDVVFPDTTSLGGQPVNCTTVGAAFGIADCTLSGDEYILDFSAGSGIDPWSGFIIVEDGVDPSVFPTGTAIANPTPEPSSIWLALSGAGSLGYLVRRRRKGFVV